MNDIITAHEHSIRHKKELHESDICGCFYCCKIFSPQKIIEWTADGCNEMEQTGLCPYCGIDSIIGDKSGYPIKNNFLKAMNKKWF